MLHGDAVSGSGERLVIKQLQSPPVPLGRQRSETREVAEYNTDASYQKEIINQRTDVILRFSSGLACGGPSRALGIQNRENRYTSHLRNEIIR